MINTEVIIRIITGFTGTVGFSLLYNIRGRYLLLASSGGFLATLINEILIFCGLSETLSYFLVAVCISLYSEIFARIVKTPTTTFIIPALIPLIPGGALYYTMSYGIAKKWNLFFEYAYYSLGLALSLAIAIILTTTVFQLFNGFLYYKRSKKTNE